MPNALNEHVGCLLVTLAEIFRLRGWEYRPGTTKRPMLMARLTADLVYSRLAPGVLEELRRLTPKDDKGRRKNKLFQWLTADIGHPALRDHVTGITFLAKSHKDGDWDNYYDAVERAAPQFGRTMLLPFSIDIQVNDSLSVEDTIEAGVEPLVPEGVIA